MTRFASSMRVAPAMALPNFCTARDAESALPMMPPFFDSPTCLNHM